METGARVEELRVAIATIEDSATSIVPSTSFHTYLPITMYTSHLSLEDVERSISMATAERDSLLQSLAMIREETSKAKECIESMQKSIHEDDRNEGTVKDLAMTSDNKDGNHGPSQSSSKMLVEESDLQVLLDLKHLQVERDFRVKQYETMISNKEVQDSKIKQQLTKLQAVQTKLMEKQRNIDQWLLERMNVQELLYQSQTLLQGAFDKVATEVRFHFISMGFAELILIMIIYTYIDEDV
jgi:hypothetical protein